MATNEQIATALANGILRPRRVSAQAGRVGLPFHVACAYLMQESAGGENVYGHDRNADGTKRIFWGHGEVTECNYAAYLKEVERSGERQGVGPMQLTWHSFQTPDIWRYNVNLRTGFGVVRDHMDTPLATIRRTYPNAEDTLWWRLHYSARRYNGKESYATEMDVRFAHWRRLVGAD